MGLTKEDREVLDALENAGKLYERYLELSRITDLTPDEPEPEPPPSPSWIWRHKNSGRVSQILEGQAIPVHAPRPMTCQHG